MNSLINKLGGVDLNSQYVIPTPPSILMDTNFILTGFESYEVVDIITAFLQKKKYKIEFTNIRYIVKWTISKLYNDDLDCPYCKYTLTLYLKNKEHTVEVYKLFGNDDIYSSFFTSLEDVFR
jgi:hypothetical protein